MSSDEKNGRMSAPSACHHVHLRDRVVVDVKGTVEGALEAKFGPLRPAHVEDDEMVPLLPVRGREGVHPVVGNAAVLHLRADGLVHGYDGVEVLILYAADGVLDVDELGVEGAPLEEGLVG
jgi:hypothetical protein